MKIDKSYIEFIQSIKQQIVQSRYAAARLANREQLMLYFKTGVMILRENKGSKMGSESTGPDIGRPTERVARFEGVFAGQP